MHLPSLLVNTSPCILTTPPPQHYLGEECRRGCRRNGGRRREEQGPGWGWGMKTSPCPQRKSLAAGGCPALADSLGRQGQGCDQEATPASHLLAPLPIATSPSLAGQLEGDDFKCHLPPPPQASFRRDTGAHTHRDPGGADNVARPLGWGRWAGRGVRGSGVTGGDPGALGAAG